MTQAEAFEAGQKLAAEKIRTSLKDNLMKKIKSLREKSPGIVGWREQSVKPPELGKHLR